MHGPLTTAAVGAIQERYESWNQSEDEDETGLFAAFTQLVDAMEVEGCTAEEKWATQQMIQAWMGPDTDEGMDAAHQSMDLLFSAWRVKEPA